MPAGVENDVVVDVENRVANVGLYADEKSWGADDVLVGSGLEGGC